MGKGVVNIQRLADGSLVLAPAERAIALPPGWTIEDHPLDWLAGSADGPEQVQGYSQLVPPAPPGTLTLGGQTPPQYQLSTTPTITTTDGSTATLASIPCPAGKLTTVEIRVTAWIVTAATSFSYYNVVTAQVARIGSAAPVGPVNMAEVFFSNASPAAPFAAAGSPGGIGFVISGNSLVLQAKGIGAPTAWSAGAFTVGQLVTKGGSTYIVAAIAGTGTSTTGPSGTGTGQVDNAGTNQVVWDYLAPGSSVPINWCAAKVEILTP